MAIMDIETVKAFLDNFKAKARAFGIRFRIERTKNFQGLLDLGISAKEREDTVMKLEPTDYYKGPTENTLDNNGDLWEFGKRVKKNDVYIKLAEGKIDHEAVCVSFHPAERPLSYPLKQAKKTKQDPKKNGGKDGKK